MENHHFSWENPEGNPQKNGLRLWRLLSSQTNSWSSCKGPSFQPISGFGLISVAAFLWRSWKNMDRNMEKHG